MLPGCVAATREYITLNHGRAQTLAHSSACLKADFAVSLESAFATLRRDLGKPQVRVVSTGVSGIWPARPVRPSARPAQQAHPGKGGTF